MQCGPMRHQIATREGPAGEIDLQLEVRETPFTVAGAAETPIHELFRLLVEDERRRALVCADVLDALAEGRRCLLLSQWKDQVKDPGLHQRRAVRDDALATRRSYTGRMTVTIDIPEDALARLQAEAKRRGVSIDLVIAELTQALPTEPTPGKTLSFIGLGSSRSGRYARDTDDLLADGFGRD